jgi:hypothetical protein
MAGCPGLWGRGEGEIAGCELVVAGRDPPVLLGRDGAASILAPAARVILGQLYNNGDGNRLLDDTARKLAVGEPIPGWPRLAERIGEKRGRKLAEWLGVNLDRRTSRQAMPNSTPPTTGWPWKWAASGATLDMSRCSANGCSSMAVAGRQSLSRGAHDG